MAMSVLSARDDGLEPDPGSLHGHIKSKCRAIPEIIELFGYQCNEDAAMQYKLSGRSDNLSARVFKGEGLSRTLRKERATHPRVHKPRYAFFDSLYMGGPGKHLAAACHMNVSAS